MRIPFLSLFIALGLLSACNEGHVDTKAVKQGVEEHKVFHITDAELTAAAEVVGQRAVRLIDSAQRTATNQSPPKEFAEASGKVDTVYDCRWAIQHVLKELAGKDIKATRLAFDTWDPSKDLPKVNEVLEAVKYTHDQGQPVPSNLQRDEQGGFHYVEAITAASSCQPCHAAWKEGQEVGVFNIRYTTKPAAKEASKGKKGM